MLLQGRSQQTQNICITFIQRLPNVLDVGPTLYKSYTNVLYLLQFHCIKEPLAYERSIISGATNTRCD